MITPMKATTFVIDSMPGHVFKGFTKDETWNGWSRPFFTHDVAMKIVTAHKEQGLNAYYNKESDEFAFEVPASSGDYDIFPSVEIANMKLYSIGAGCWIWEESAEGEQIA